MQDWQAIAKALPVGQSRKVLHCGSSPAAKVSQNGAGLLMHCFRCGETEFIPHGPRSTAEILAARQATESLSQARCIPARAIHLTDPQCPSTALLWPLRAGLTPETASSVYGMRYDPVTQRVLIPLKEGFLARAVNNERPKYIKAGAKDTETYCLFDKGGDLVIVTEDILSAIAVNRAGFNSIAVLGTSFSATITAEIGAFSTVICWTDADKAGDEAFVKLRKRLRLYDTKLLRIRTEKDPKQVHKAQIKAIIGDSYVENL